MRRTGPVRQILHRAVESAVDHIQLLFASELDEVHRITRNADSELRIQFRVFHGVQQGFALEHVDVDVEAAAFNVALALAIKRPRQTR